MWKRCLPASWRNSLHPFFNGKDCYHKFSFKLTNAKGIKMTQKNTLSITDNRTGKIYELPIEHDTIRAIDLRQIKVQDDDFGMMTFDPGFTNTASCISRITEIDGDRGILRYRGYPIEQLAEKCTYMETAYLLLNGELPNKKQLEGWREDIIRHMYVHENLKKFIDGFQYDAHPMGMLVSTLAALSTYYPEAKQLDDPENRRKQIVRIIAKMPTLASFAYRHRVGRPYIYPSARHGFIGNFLRMLTMRGDEPYEKNPVLERALNVLFILHADHEQNCSTSIMRSIGSSHADPYSAVAGAAAGLYGPLHGGANEAVLRMLGRIGDKKNIPDLIKRVKDGKERLMGFGHRVYKNYDPRAKVIKKIADEVFEEVGKNPLLDIALELEKIALEDEYFVKRKLYPNVDFYSGLIYQAMGFPTDMFVVLFALPRTAGWMAQWEEFMNDPDKKIARPRQIYLGEPERNFIEIDKRK
jgi:citrate synthase